MAGTSSSTLPESNTGEQPVMTPAAIPPPVEPPPPVLPPPASNKRAEKSDSNKHQPSLMDRMKGNPDGDGSQMSFMDHLLELRKRLWTSLVSILLCMVLALVFYAEIFQFLRTPLDNVNSEYMAQPIAYENLLDELKLRYDSLPQDVAAQLKKIDPKSDGYARSLQTIELPPNADDHQIAARIGEFAQSHASYNNALKVFQLPPRANLLQITSINLMGTMMMIMWLGIGAGLVLSSPIVIYELWSFVSPGLRLNEKKAIQPILFGGIFFFIGGCAITYYLLFPVTLKFAVWLDLRLQVRPLYTVHDYMSLLLNMMWISGLICETPLVVGALAKLSVVKHEYLTRYWRACVLVAFVFGSIFSPGTDVMSMIVFSALLMGLYVISIFMAYFFYPKQKTA